MKRTERAKSYDDKLTAVQKTIDKKPVLYTDPSCLFAKNRHPFNFTIAFRSQKCNISFIKGNFHQ